MNLREGEGGRWAERACWRERVRWGLWWRVGVRKPLPSLPSIKVCHHVASELAKQKLLIVNKS